jgi:hypothetical protein
MGYFATWLPSSNIELGDIGVLDAGRFRRVGSLKELGNKHPDVREGNPENVSYSASAKRNEGASGGASAPVVAGRAELSIKFTSQGGYVFEAISMRHVEIADRLALAESLLEAFKKGRWQEEWLLVESFYNAGSATIIVSEDTTSEVVLKASAAVPLGTLPLADPKLGLTVASSTGKVVHCVAANNLRPLYSCVKVRDPLIGKPSVVPVRGASEDRTRALRRLSIDDLLDS